MSGLAIAKAAPPNLPALPDTVLPAIAALTAALGVPRDVLASDDDIEHAWRDLPRELKEIPVDLRGELVARMCVAVSAGLFDGAMNYIWNAAIIHLRAKVRTFGLPVVAQILQADFEEKHLNEMQDSKLLDLCLKINLVDEDGFFFLDQCRDIRNNFSAAHPTMGAVNDREFTTFLNRCVRYALADASSPKGVDIGSFISALKGGRFTANQLSTWVDRLLQTHAAQRQLLVGMVHGIYCDPNTSEPARLNSLEICEALAGGFTQSLRSDLVHKHGEYAAKGDEPRYTASSQFFEKLGLIKLLNESEQHNIFHRAIDRLWSVHTAMNNFYNEPPFAERLQELSSQGAVPDTIQEEFVRVVVCCRIGNGYGVSNAAVPSYDKIIEGFSPREVATLLQLASSNSNYLGRRVAGSASCKRHFIKALGLIDPGTVPNVVRPTYDQFLK
ncbi:hypothetical protein [Rhizobium sp. A37_96]